MCNTEDGRCSCAPVRSDRAGVRHEGRSHLVHEQLIAKALMVHLAPEHVADAVFREPDFDLAAILECERPHP